MAGIAALGLVMGGWSLAGSARADSLTISDTSAADAAQQIAQKYGVSVVFRGNFDTGQLVNVSINDADSPGSRLAAISALGDAVGADFQKTFVISKMAVDQQVPDPPIDSTGNVVFPSLTMPARRAIEMVTGVDDATAQFYGGIDGTVTLTSTQESARDAAAEIARQTHTRWKGFYALIPRLQRQNVVGKVIDHNGNSPIIEEPLIYYQNPQDQQAQAAAEQTAAQQAAAAQAAAQQANANNQAVANGQQAPNTSDQNNPNNPYAMANNGYSPYGYAYNPYGNGYDAYGNGYNPYGYAYSPYGNGYSPYDYGYGGNSYGMDYGYGYGPDYGYGYNPGYDNLSPGNYVSNGYGSGQIGTGLDIVGGGGGGLIISNTGYGYVP
jgi:hypothetical protein